MIFILEDNLERIAQFRESVATLPTARLQIWSDANTMSSDLIDELEHASLISLDHDLVQPTGQPDPGTGQVIADLLAQLIPCCPIIIHTSNTAAGTKMNLTLIRAGWIVTRVYPFQDTWITKSWLPTVKTILLGQI